MKLILHAFKITYAITGLLFLFSNHSNANLISKSVTRSILPTTIAKDELITPIETTTIETPSTTGNKNTNTKDKRPIVASCTVQSEFFPRSPSNPKPQGGTDFLPGWSVSGNYNGNIWDADKGFIELDGSGLLFKRDISTTTTVSKQIAVPSNIVLTFDLIGWVNTYEFAPDGSGQSFFEIRLGGVLYAKINTGTGNSGPTISTANGAISNIANLQPSNGSGVKSNVTYLSLSLPNSASSSTSLEFKFLPGSSPTEADDIFFSGITISTDRPTANAGSGFTKNCVSNTAGNYIGAASASDVNYSWTASSGTLPTGPNPLVNPSVTTTYTLTATKFYSSCSASNAVTVTVNTTVPVANAGSPFTKTCASNVNGNTIGAPAITGESYNWTASAGSAVPAAISNPTVNPSVTTTYEVTAKNNLSLCTSKAQVLVKVDTVAPPTPNLIKNSIPNECPRVTVNLNSLVTNTTNLKWYKESARINEVTNPTAVSVSGLYYAFYLDSANGCFSNSTTAVANAVITVPCCRALFAPDLTN